MFKSLFQNIFSGRKEDDPVLIAYNQGVKELSLGNISQAITFFEPICEQHSSAAYNLGLIYLNGAGKITPKYHLARKYLALANEIGHPKAAKSALLIGLNEVQKFSMENQFLAFQFGLKQYLEGKQLGNLAYMIAYDIIHNVLETSTNKLYSLDRFISYELYCIRNYGNKEVMDLYRTSSLTTLPINYEEDWECGKTAVISDYLNDKVFSLIVALSQGKLQLEQLGAVRLAAVNAVYEYYL